MKSPEFATPEPISLYTPFITGQGRERFPRLRLCGAALVGAALGVAVGAMIGAVATEIPIDRITDSPEAIGFIGKVSGLFGLASAGWGAAIYYAEH